MATTSNIVSRGYVLIYRDHFTGTTKVSAVVSGPMVKSMARKTPGRIVSAKGLRYRMAQRTLRALVNPAEALERETAVVR